MLFSKIPTVGGGRRRGVSLCCPVCSIVTLCFGALPGRRSVVPVLCVLHESRLCGDGPKCTARFLSWALPPFVRLHACLCLLGCLFLSSCRTDHGCPTEALSVVRDALQSGECPVKTVRTTARHGKAMSEGPVGSLFRQAPELRCSLRHPGAAAV
jgi:hypothetical protein